MTIMQLVFYLFSAVLLLSGIMVITSRNPVHGVLFLVLAFFASAILWMLLEAEFLALTLIFVYVGAVMTLFLFVVMMLNIDLVPLRGSFVRYLPFGILVMVLLAALMLLVVGPKHFGLAHYQAPPLAGPEQSNVQMLGDVLYTQYVYPFEIAAVLLLVAIIAAVGLAHRGPRKSKVQRTNQQVSVRPEDRVRLIDMPSEKP
jgi:NADH-quinone oxidoreductase subunit J